MPLSSVKFSSFRPFDIYKSLCPVIFLIIIWKIVSKYFSVLHSTYSWRIPLTFPKCLSSSHKFLAARVQNHWNHDHWNRYMPLASDTSKREKLIETLESFLWENEIQIIRILLSNTIIGIKSSSNISNHFNTNIGCPQGDSLSGSLFIIFPNKTLRIICDRVDNNHVTSEYSHAVLYTLMSASKLMTQIRSTILQRGRKGSCSYLPLLLLNSICINDNKIEDRVLKRDES